MTDIEGVKVDSQLVSHLTGTDAENYIRNKIIVGGMIPKVESALAALNREYKKSI